MTTIIDSLRDIVGIPDFYVRLGGTTSNYSWDYGAMIEYFCAVLILCVVISSAFRFLMKLIK